MEFNFKKILPWILIAIVVLGITIWLGYRLTAEKKIEVISPNDGEILQANKTYQITWKARNIGKVGIILIKDKTPKESEWIVKDFPAGKGEYDWQIFVWQEPRQDYKIAVVEYPWQEGNKIDESDKSFTILGPTFASCDKSSIEDEWLYLPSDFPNLKKVFITNTAFNGNLGGLEGADEKCQKEAEEKGLEGTWKAFLGDDTSFAIERLDLEGVFVEAEGKELLPVGKIPDYFFENFKSFLKKIKLEKEREAAEEAYSVLEKYFEKFLEEWKKEQEKKTCHRLLGKNFNEFFQKLSDPLVLNQEKLEEKFLKDLSNLWIGRINKESKKDCLNVFTEYPSRDPSFNYSFTTTCQNWTVGEERIPGYPPKEGEKLTLPICYTPAGEKINPAALAGLSSGIIIKKEEKKEEKEGEKFFTSSLGELCNLNQKLLCIQQ